MLMMPLVVLLMLLLPLGRAAADVCSRHCLICACCNGRFTVG
jgi:hypothetical protein